MKTMRSGDGGVAIDMLVTAAGGAANISTATTKEFTFIAPGGSKITKAAAFVTDGTDGKLRYVTVLGDFTEVGLWLVQAHVILGTGEDVHSSVDEFDVTTTY